MGKKNTLYNFRGMLDVELRSMDKPNSSFNQTFEGVYRYDNKKKNSESKHKS